MASPQHAADGQDRQGQRGSAGPEGPWRRVCGRGPAWTGVAAPKIEIGEAGFILSMGPAGLAAPGSPAERAIQRAIDDGRRRMMSRHQSARPTSREQRRRARDRIQNAHVPEAALFELACRPPCQRRPFNLSAPARLLCCLCSLLALLARGSCSPPCQTRPSHMLRPSCPDCPL